MEAAISSQAQHLRIPDRLGCIGLQTPKRFFSLIDNTCRDCFLYITNSHNDQLPVGLIAQLVEHCTGIAEVMGSNPVQG